MAMIISHEARLAQVEIGAVFAGNEGRSRKFCCVLAFAYNLHLRQLTVDAAIASTLLKVDGSRDLDLLLLLDLAWSASLGHAGDDDTIANEALDHPVIIAVAVDTTINTLLAKIEIALFADTTVVVLIGNGMTAIVAVDAEGATEVAKIWKSWLAEIARARGRSRRRIYARLRGAESARHADTFIDLCSATNLRHVLEVRHWLRCGERLRQDSLKVG